MFRWTTLLVAAALMTAQEPSAFRVNTRLVEVDVVVRSKNGAVTGLTKGDFRILDNGKPQNIATFNVRSSTVKGKTPVAPLAAGVVSNRVDRTGDEPVAATVILVDRLNTAVEDQAYFGKELLKYLKTLQPGEHIALYSLLKSLRVLQDFTDDPQRVMQAAGRANAQQSVSLAASDESVLKTQVDSIRQMADPGNPAEVAAMALQAEMSVNAIMGMEDAEKKNRALITTLALEDIARHLRGLPGRKKLVWVSDSFPVGTLEVKARHNDGFGEEVARAVRALNNANVAVYAIDPRGLVALGNAPATLPAKTVTGRNIFAGVAPPPDPMGVGTGLFASNIAAMNLLASGTGGRAIYGSNDMVGAMKTVMEDDDVVYTLGFYPGDQKMDGSYRSLSVKLARKGVEVHHRRGYFASDTKVYTSGQRRDAMNIAVQNPLDSTELGLQALATPVSDKPGIYLLAVTLNINELRLEHQRDRWIGMIDFGTHFSLALDLRGTHETIRMSLTEDRLRESLRDGFTIQREIDTGGETGELRIVIQDRSTGAIGSVRVPIGTE